MQDTTILNILAIDKIINDFAAAKPTAGNGGLIGDILKVVAPVFSMADKVIKQGQGLGQIADFSGFIGGAIGEVAASFALSGVIGDGQPTVDVGGLTRAVESTLSNMFNSTNNNLKNMNSLLFGGTSEIQDLSSLTNGFVTATGQQVDPNLHQDISKVFSTGAFLTDQSNAQDNIVAGLTAGMNLVKQQLVGAVLAAQSIVVWQNTKGSEASCNTITGARWLDNTCFTLQQLHIVNGPGDSTPVAKEVMLKFDDPSAGYNINVEAFYRNVQACNNNNGAPSGAITFDGDFPPCAFGLPFVSAPDRVCNTKEPLVYNRALDFGRCFGAPDTTFTEAGGFATPVADCC